MDFVEESKKTDWQGLWFQREGVYSGQTLSKKDIPPYAKLIVRYNRYYDKGSKRPKFVYCFAQREAANAITMETSKHEYVEAENVVGMAKDIEELASVMRQGNSNADKMMLPSESQANAKALMERAIELIERITGEEWNFTSMDFGW